MQNNRILSGLGLAQKAGCIASGEFAVEKAVKGGLAHVGDRGRRCFGQYKEENEKYVQIFMRPLCIFMEEKMILGALHRQGVPFYG